MAKLRKKVFYPNATNIRPTKEDLDNFEEAWQILYKTGSVCVNNPSNSEKIHEIMDSVKRGNFISVDYDGDLPYEEFFDRLMSGEYDGK